MRKLCIMLITVVISLAVRAQTYYFKGEWTKPNTAELFTCICKVNVLPGGTTSAQFIWTYVSIDSNDADLVKYYEDKKGKVGAEFLEGDFDSKTRFFNLASTDLVDPSQIIGKSKYSIRFTADGKCLYGSTTDPDGNDPGLFVATRTTMTAAQFDQLKHAIK